MFLFATIAKVDNPLPSAAQKSLEHIFDVSCIRALADAGINRLAMPLVEAPERTRLTPDNQVDQLDV